MMASPDNLMIYPQEAAIRSLAGTMSSNLPLCNILLSARQTWWQGCPGLCEGALSCLPAVDILIKTLSRELASEYHAWLCAAFKRFLFCPTGGYGPNPDGRPKDDSCFFLLHGLIHAAPLDLPTVSEEGKRRHSGPQSRIIKAFTTFSRRLRSDSSIDDLRKTGKEATALAGLPQDSATGAYMAPYIPNTYETSQQADGKVKSSEQGAPGDGKFSTL